MEDVLNHANLVHWAEMGLVIFFVVFIGTTIWTLTRSKREVEHWASLPLSGGSGEGGESDEGRLR